MKQQILYMAFIWIARIWGGMAILFWGALFFGHIGAFMSGIPPLTALIKIILIFLILLGFITAYRWKRFGSMTALLSTLALILDMYISIHRAGRNFELANISFIIATLPPALLYIASSYIDRSGK